MPYIGEIRLFASDKEVEGWLPCDGRKLPVAQYRSLYFAIRNYYDSSPSSAYFSLPDLRGKAAIHRGTSPGLVSRPFAFSGGQETTTLELENMPSHSHRIRCQKKTSATTDKPDGNFLATAQNPPLLAGGIAPPPAVFGNSGDRVNMKDGIVKTTGEGKPHENMPPYLYLQYMIATDGDSFPGLGQ